MEKQAKIFVAGSDTLIGGAILRELRRQGYEGVISESSDLTEAHSVQSFFTQQRIDYVFLTAGKSGGIGANTKYPATLMLDNLLIEANVIRAAHHHGAKKLLYLASSCIYPKHAPQPLQIESLFTGKLESTNEAYATAKIAGLVLCQAYRQEHGDTFIVGIPANAFGEGDDFSLEESHVIAALIRKMREAKMNRAPVVDVWGSGKPRREFIYADDLASACVFTMQNYDSVEPINLGGGLDVSIAELAQMIKKVVGYEGELRFDSSKPDGMPLKSLDSSMLLSMGWKAKTPFEEALQKTYTWFLEVGS
mgnify:CR=1 FL=1